MPRKTKKEKARELKKKRKENAVKKFRSELKKSIITAIVAAFGFLTALAWRDVIIEFIEKIKSTGPLQGKLVTALIITIISVIVTMLVSKFMLTE